MRCSRRVGDVSDLVLSSVSRVLVSRIDVVRQSRSREEESGERVRG